ncbi:MAG: hypothetical protein AB7P03_00485 [Kofleriaceae bacterium]
MRKALCSLGVLWLLARGGVAVAQPGAQDPGVPPPPPDPTADPAMPPPAPPAPPEAAPVPPMQPMSMPPAVATTDPGIVQDANSGRGWLIPTALTPPAGTWSFTDFELLLVSVSYSPTDQLVLTGATVLPVVEDMPVMLFFSGKYKLFKSGRVHAALQGGLSSVWVDDDNATAAEIGGALTLCVDAPCHSYVSGFLGAGFAHEDQSAVPFLLGGTAAFRMARHLKLIVEADTGFIAGEIDAFANGFLFWYGVRFTSSFLGVDLGFAKPICTGDEDCDTGLPMGLPFVSFSYRNLNE